VEQKFTIDFGAVNLSSLILTNDVTLYDKAKAQNNIGVLFEPTVLEEMDNYKATPFYLIGILEGK